MGGAGAPDAACNCLNTRLTSHKKSESSEKMSLNLLIKGDLMPPRVHVKAVIVPGF